jgi:hypothetical protein
VLSKESVHILANEDSLPATNVDNAINTRKIKSKKKKTFTLADFNSISTSAILAGAPPIAFDDWLNLNVSSSTNSTPDNSPGNNMSAPAKRVNAWGKGKPPTSSAVVNEILNSPTDEQDPPKTLQCQNPPKSSSSNNGLIRADKSCSTTPKQSGKLTGDATPKNLGSSASPSEVNGSVKQGIYKYISFT